MNDLRIRSLVKGLTWRVVAFFDTSFLAYIFTGSIKVSLKISFVELFTKTFLFYLHERAWRQIHIGIVDSKETHYRSLLKGVSWRIFGTIDTTIIAFFITGDYSAAFSIGFFEIFTKVFLFFLHEKVWQKISWGKKI